MLHHTFCHIPGVGLKTESALWEAGILSWDDVFDGRLKPLWPRKSEVIQHYLSESLDALDHDDVAYFADRLPENQHWRLFETFRHVTAYLDIETTGLGGPSDIVTTIGIYDGVGLHHYVHGKNLDDFARDVERFKLLVTYNGKCFDLPFIRSYLGLELPQAHIDLMFVLRALGYRGGLKGCEKQLGIDRGDLEGIDGYFAVLLWQVFCRRGLQSALDTLLAYNSVDVINLEILMVLAHNMRIQDTPFADSHRLPLPAPVEIPHPIDLDLIHKIRSTLSSF